MKAITLGVAAGPCKNKLPAKSTKGTRSHPDDSQKKALCSAPSRLLLLWNL